LNLNVEPIVENPDNTTTGENKQSISKLNVEDLMKEYHDSIKYLESAEN